VWLNEKLLPAQNNPRHAAAVIDICNKGARLDLQTTNKKRKHGNA
jgi:hypothetical protein